MSLATILEKIQAEANAHGEQILAQARHADGQFAMHARTQAEAEAAQILRHASEELQALQRKEMATTLLHLRKAKLDNRQRLLEAVFAEALRRITSYNAAEGQAAMRAILLAIPEERPGQILLSDRDRPLVTLEFIADINAALAAQGRKLQFTISPQTVAIENGFILDFIDFEMNYSIEKVLAGLWEEIRGDVSRRLFHDQDAVEG